MKYLVVWDDQVAEAADMVEAEAAKRWLWNLLGVVARIEVG